MGIVANQAIKNVFYTYIGFAIGALNTLFLFTHILDKELYGVITYLLAASNLFWPVLSLGLQNTLIKFFKSYKTFKAQSALFSWSLFIPIILSSICIITFKLCNDSLHKFFLGSNPIIYQYIYSIIVISISVAYFELFFSWCKVHLKTTYGNLLKEVFNRLTISILLICYYFSYIDFDSLIYGIVCAYLVRTLLIILYAISIKVPHFNFKSIDNLRQVFSYTLLILIAAFVSVYLIDMDKVMIERFLSVDNVAVYSICVFMATVVEVPKRALLQITNPLTAQFLNLNKLQSLKDLNQKSSITGLIVSCLIAILVFTNANSLFLLIPSSYDLLIEVVFLIITVKLFDCSLGVSNAIIINSDSYKLILVIGVVILVIAYYLNLFFIPLYGVVGAGLATFISYFIYNTVKLTFVWFKFKTQPYTLNTLKVMAISFVFLILFYHLDFLKSYPIIAISIKLLFTTILYLFIIYKLSISEEINKIIDKFIRFQFLTEKNK